MAGVDPLEEGLCRRDREFGGAPVASPAADPGKEERRVAGDARTVPRGDASMPRG